LFQLIIIVIQIDVAVECSAMVQDATVVLRATLAHNARVALNAYLAAAQRIHKDKSEEMIKNLRLEASPQS
jgi:hypothetical protein